MTSILKTQLFRLKKSKLFWALLIVTAVLPLLELLLNLLILWAAGSAFDEVPELKTLLEMTGNGTMTFTQLGSSDSLASDSALLAVICSAVVLSKEFSQGTVRNAILADKSRKSLFLGYGLIALIIGGSYYVAQFVSTLVFFGSIMGFAEVAAGKAIVAILCHFLIGLLAAVTAQSCVCMFLFLTRSTAATIILPLVVVAILPSLVSSILMIATTIGAISGNVLSETAAQCIPFYNTSASVMDFVEPAALNVCMALLYYVVFSAAFVVAGFFPFQKADLK